MMQDSRVEYLTRKNSCLSSKTSSDQWYLRVRLTAQLSMNSVLKDGFVSHRLREGFQSVID